MPLFKKEQKITYESSRAGKKLKSVPFLIESVIELNNKREGKSIGSDARADKLFHSEKQTFIVCTSLSFLTSNHPRRREQIDFFHRRVF